MTTFSQPKRKMGLLSLVVPAIVAALCFSMPAYAIDYDDMNEALAHAKEIKNSITSAKNEYLQSVQRAQEIKAQKEVAEERLSEIESELAAAQDSLGESAVFSYKNSRNYIEVILKSMSFEEFMSTVECFNRIVEERERLVQHVLNLQREQEELSGKLKQQMALLEEQSVAATSIRETYEEKLEVVKEELKPMQDALANSIGSKDGYAQMHEILDYLEAVGETTEEQVAIIESAYAMAGAGGYGNLCEAFAEQIMRNAGISVNRYISAWANCQENMVSSDWSEAKVGCFAYGSGSGYMGSLYGHVGVIVYADGDPDHIRIIDNADSAGVSQTLAEWEKWQTAVNADTGDVGLFGWGYPPGYEW